MVVSNNPGEEAVEDGCDNVEDDTVASRLLLGAVPHGDDEGNGRNEERLKATKKETADKEGGESGASGHGALKDTPAEDGKGEVDDGRESERRLEGCSPGSMDMDDVAYLCMRYADGAMKSRPPKKGADPTQEYSLPDRFRSFLMP